MLPISHQKDIEINFIDALFTATTATCVTGLVTVTTATSWSFFGQIVILLLIQIGGLGVITILAGIMILLNKKFGLKDSQIIQDAFNLNTFDGLKKFIKKVLLGSLIIEGIGALLYMIVFIPQYGLSGIWISIFNAISAFCNAGMDIIGNNSLCSYSTNFIVNFTTSMLIILGGIGFIVWWDVIRVIRNFKNQKFKCLNNLTLHTKIALSSSILLILVGGLLILIFEYNNPQTIQALSFFDKLQVSLFQSITTRTAGFASVPQESLTNASSMVCIILMFIGGSPVGTAGGIKTVTFVVLIATAISTIKNNKEVVLFNRTLSRDITRKAVAVCFMSLFIFITATLLLIIIHPEVNILDIMYETVSATSTVGLTKNLTPYLTIGSKIIIVLTMLLGRVGPISLATMFNINKNNENIIKNPIEEVRIG